MLPQLNRGEGETVAVMMPRPLSEALYFDWLDSSTDVACDEIIIC